MLFVSILLAHQIKIFLRLRISVRPKCEDTLFLLSQTVTVSSCRSAGSFHKAGQELTKQLNKYQFIFS